ncbi:MAG: methyltransferase domain-containing protein [Nitrososphaerales archaeon]
MICRVCGEERVREFLSLGKLPLGNAFLLEDHLGDEKMFDLNLGFCENCTLVQQISPPPQEALAADYMNYRYVPYGMTLKRHYRELAEALAKDIKITRNSLIVDIGSNDGTLLSSIKRIQSCKVLGIEPAEQISEGARNEGIPTITAFFSDKVGEQIVSAHGYADVVCTTQVLQHIPHPNDFISGVSKILRHEGMYLVEGRYFADTMAKTTFDTFYHEMLYFFTARSLGYLLRKHNLTPWYAKQVSIYGGSLRIYARKSSGKIGNSVFEISESEKKAGLGEFVTYEEFAKRVYKMRDYIAGYIRDLKSSGKTIAGYGAPSTGTTLMNFCGIGRDLVDYIVDDSPLKQGLLQPGTHIPIVDSRMLAENTPDYLLVIAWRLKEDILSKVKQYREKGMKVIIPLPEVDIV